jgi:hypothetical protein
MTYKEQRELVSDLRMLADFYERPESIVLPKMHVSEWAGVDTWEYNAEEGKYVVNLEKGKAKLKAIVKALGSCEKNFTSSSLEVRKKLNERVTLNYHVNREAFCKRVPTGEKRVIPAREETVEEVYDWICEDTSILGS